MHFPTFVLAATSAFIAVGISQTIDPNSVPLATRDSWCTSQLAACPLICTQETNGSAATTANDCDAASLQYDCVCENGLAPNVSEYSQTVPYYICTEANNQCVTNCGLSNNACAAACTQNHPCGAQNPTRANNTSTASGTASATGSGSASTGSAVYTGFGSSATQSGSSSSSSGSSSGSKSSSASRIMINLGQIYGLGVVATGIFAGFTLLL